MPQIPRYPSGKPMSAAQGEIQSDTQSAYKKVTNRPGVSQGQNTRTLMIQSGTPVKEAWKKVPSYKKGGKVKKTGLAKLHKGERVLNTKQTKKYEKTMKNKRDARGIRTYK